MNRVIVLAVAVLALPTRVMAHHSNAEYDFGVFEELEGQVVAISWRNPHVQLTLRGAAGETWDLEAQDVNTLGRRGLDPSLIRPGDTVRVAGNPSRRRERTMFVTNVLLANGTEIRTRGDTAPRWSEEHIGFSEVVLANVQAAAKKTTGIFRVWINTGNEEFSSDLPLTAAARAAQAAWDPADNLNSRCISAGMPAAMRMSAWHPIELEQHDGDIIIRNELFDIVRTIHMASSGDAAPRAPSALGYSQGHWEGPTLVVHTNRIDRPHFERTGAIPLSEAVDVVERFTSDDAHNRLLYEITVSDPATFTEPVSAHWELDWRPDLVVEPYECTLEG